MGDVEVRGMCGLILEVVVPAASSKQRTAPNKYDQQETDYH